MSSAGMNVSNAYTPALKFMSTDPQFTTENPKLLALIVGRATETYDSDSKGGMALDFATTPNAPGTTNVPIVRMTISEAGQVGILNTAPNEALEVTGNIVIRNPELNPALIISPSSGGYAVDAELYVQSAETTGGTSAAFHISRNALFRTSDDTYQYIDVGGAAAIGWEINTSNMAWRYAASGTGAITWTIGMYYDGPNQFVGFGADHTSPAATVDIFRDATLGGWGTFNVANAGLKITDNAYSMYADGNALISNTAGGFYIGCTNAAGFISFGVDDDEAMRIAPDGTVGIAVTPNTWDANWEALQIGDDGAVVGRTGSTGVRVTSNAYYGSSTWRRIATGYATYYVGTNVGVHNFYITTTGAAGSSITWTSALRINQDGKIGVGVTPTTSWDADWHVVRVGDQAAFANNPNVGALVLSNAYYDGSNYRYIETDYATYYSQVNSDHIFRIGDSGTAGNTITWVPVMYIDGSSRRIGLFTESPTYDLDLVTATSAIFAMRTTATSSQNVAIFFTGARTAADGDLTEILFFNNESADDGNENARILVEKGANNDSASISLWTRLNTAASLTKVLECLEDYGVLMPNLKSGATSAAAGAATGELWVTSGHATLPDGVVMQA